MALLIAREQQGGRSWEGKLKHPGDLLYQSVKSGKRDGPE